jgi:predicted membrane protein
MDNQHYKSHNSKRAWVGAVLLIIGLIALVKNIGFFVPDWITSWPMILLIIGLILGFRHSFRHTGAVILIFLGSLFLVIRIIPNLEMHNFVWPAILIGLGLYQIFGRGRKGSDYSAKWRTAEWDKRVNEEGEVVDASSGSKEDYLSSVSIFGGIKKNVVSKNFRGGEIVTIMGGAEVNLSQSDIKEPIVLEVVQVFGGTKIILPPHWKVSSEMAAIFGGIEDKRMLTPETAQSDKMLIIKGTSIFGGIEIRSF